MILSKSFERFTQRRPLSVMARAMMERALEPDALDALFDEHAGEQYTRKLLFSSVVNLMGVVVSKVAPSVHSAYQDVADELPVSLTSLYNKINGMAPAVTAQLVSHTSRRLAPVIVAMKGQVPALLPGLRVRIVDGNHLAATERRLKVLRGSIAGPLPGHALVVMDPQLMLATHIVPCEDGHAQERSLSDQLLDLVEAKDVWIADRNFCTCPLLSGIEKRGSYYVIRHHANMRVVAVGPVKPRGRTDTGKVFEQEVTILDTDGKPMRARRITIQLDKPTRDGDTEMAILTNLPRSAASAVAIADLYRKRWTLETMFQALTATLEGEVAALGYPRAALFGFGVALVTYNILSTVQAALRAHYGVEKVQEDVSGYYIANQVRAAADGLSTATDPSDWEPFYTVTPAVLAATMLRLAANVDLRKLKKHTRGPKKPVPKRTRFAAETHVSTARLLAESRKKAP